MKNILQLSDTAKKLMIMLGCIFVAALIVGIVFCFQLHASPIRYLLGLLIGTLLSVIKIVLLERTLNRSLDMEKQESSGFVRAHFFLRYILTAAVLVGVAECPYTNLWGAIIGLLALQLAAYLVNFFFKPNAGEQ